MPVPSFGIESLLGDESRLFSDCRLISNASDFERSESSFLCSISFLAAMAGSTASVTTGDVPLVSEVVAVVIGGRAVEVRVKYLVLIEVQ